MFNKEEMDNIKKFEKEQLELLLSDFQDIDKFTGFKDGSFKYELGKYHATLLINHLKYLEQQLKKKDEVIEKAVEYINNRWDGSSYIDETLKNKVAELNITELLQILEDKEVE